MRMDRAQLAAASVAVLVPIMPLAAELSGEVSVGYRNVSIDGDVSKYEEDINLDDGPRLFHASVTYQPEMPDGQGPDLVEVEFTGVGGDPFERARLDVRKYGSWRFSAGRWRSDYVYDDILVRPENASISGSTGGDFHHFDFERVRDDVSLDMTFNERASATLGFERYARRGESTTTLDISRDEFELEKPVDEEMQVLLAAFHYRWDKVALSLEERVRDFESDSTIFLAGFSAGENPSDLTTVSSFFLEQPYELTGHEHVLRVDAWPVSRLELGFAAAFGNVDMQTSADEESRGVGFTGAPFVTDDSGSGVADRDTSIFELDLSYTFSDRLSLSAGAARRGFDQSASMTFTAAGGGSSDWDIATSSFDAGLQFAASRNLTVSAGWYGDRRDVESNIVQAGGTPARTDADTDTNGFYATIDYRTGERFSMRASVNENDIDDPFTLASATDSTRYRLRARYAFDNGLTITAAHSSTDSANAPSGWSSDIRQTTLRLTYASKRWVLSAGASDYSGTRRADRLVIGGTRADLFPIAWGADSSTVDASVIYNFSERWRFGGAFRRYDNDGSLNVDRDFLSAFAELRLPSNYSLRLNFRDVEYVEGDIEWFDAHIAEFALGVSF